MREGQTLYVLVIEFGILEVYCIVNSDDCLPRSLILDFETVCWAFMNKFNDESMWPGWHPMRWTNVD